MEFDRLKVVQINMVANGSTGKIMLNIASILRNENIESHTFSRAWRNQKRIKHHVFLGTFSQNAWHKMIGQLTGSNGLHSVAATKSLLRRLDRIHPDVVHLHNLHGFFLNLPMLFDYLKKHNIRVVWTLHDCWSFTGQCPYFTMVGCKKWKRGCHHCDQLKVYPKSYIDKTRSMWKAKKKWFTGVDNMTIVTPSQWLADLVKQSYLKEYPIQVINNGIDLSLFQPLESNFREKHNIAADQFIVLGVAFDWGERKGLDVFIELSSRLNYQYQIVLVGVDKSMMLELPDNILVIHKTHNQKELAEIYSTANLFVNPTREDNYPTVNMEAIACGTPVLTFNTGGSPEMVDEKTGAIVECDDIDKMESEIRRICETNPFQSQDCIEKAKQFDMNDRFKEYILLYENITYSTAEPL